MSLNRKTAEAAFRQVNYARLGSLVHDNGQPLNDESLLYLCKLRLEALTWVSAIDAETHRIERAIREEETYDFA